MATWLCRNWSRHFQCYVPPSGNFTLKNLGVHLAKYLPERQTIRTKPVARNALYYFPLNHLILEIIERKCGGVGRRGQFDDDGASLGHALRATFLQYIPGMFRHSSRAREVQSVLECIEDWQELADAVSDS
jgi:hypothetical protein